MPGSACVAPCLAACMHVCGLARGITIDCLRVLKGLGWGWVVGRLAACGARGWWREGGGRIIGVPHDRAADHRLALVWCDTCGGAAPVLQLALWVVGLRSHVSTLPASWATGVLVAATNSQQPHFPVRLLSALCQRLSILFP